MVDGNERLVVKDCLYKSITGGYDNNAIPLLKNTITKIKMFLFRHQTYGKSSAARLLQLQHIALLYRTMGDDVG